jgi:tetratricopeptide (TPR) repeat protein
MRVLIALLLLGVSAPCFADRAVAKVAYDRALKSYNLGEYQAALDDFTIAYKEFPDPRLLYNTAQCYRMLGTNKPKAVILYKSYLRETGNPPNADEVRRLITLLEEDIKREQAPPPAPTTADGDKRAIAGIPYAPTTPKPLPFESWLTPRRKGGIGLMAGGTALAIIGIGLAASAPGIVGDADRAPTMADAQRTYDRAVSLNTAGWALVGVGAGVAVAGVVLVALPRRNALQAWVAPSCVGVRGKW